MSALSSYLFYNGNCAEALRFYEKALGAKIEMMMTAAESPVASQFPPEAANKVLHSTLRINGGILMASDDLSESGYRGMQGFSTSLSYQTTAEARKIFDILAEGGHITLPFDKTFWAEGFGMVVDRFGAPWMVGTDS